MFVQKRKTIINTMQKTKNKLLLIFSSFLLIAGWFGYWLLDSVLKLEHTELYPLIPAYFLVTGLSVINILTSINRENERRVVNIFLAIKISKFILSALMILMLYVLLKDNAKVLIFTFGAFYFLYMIMELYFFAQIEKTDKLNRKNGSNT